MRWEWEEEGTLKSIGCQNDAAAVVDVPQLSPTETTATNEWMNDENLFSHSRGHPLIDNLTNGQVCHCVFYVGVSYVKVAC